MFQPRSRKDTVRMLTRGIPVGIIYLLAAAGLVVQNKRLLAPQRFPYAVALTAMHSICAFVVVIILKQVCPNLFPFYREMASRGARVDILWTVLPFMPIGLMSAAALMTSNVALKFANVSTLQMIKEFQVVIVYALMLLFRMDKFRLPNALMLIGVAVFAVFAVHGQFKTNWFAIAMQVLGIFAAGLQTVLINFVMVRIDGPKCDPLTVVMVSTPAMLLVMLPFVFTHMDHMMLPRLSANWFEITLNNATAVVLQMASAAAIQEFSATGAALAGVLKDLGVLVLAMGVLHEPIGVKQAVGFTGTILCIIGFSALKLSQQAVKKEGIQNGAAGDEDELPRKKGIQDDALARRPFASSF